MEPTSATTAAVAGWRHLTTLNGWYMVGQAVGGFATAAGVWFAGWQLATWKDSKVRERRAELTENLARAVNEVFDQVENALVNPHLHISEAAQSPETPPWLGLTEMHHGCGAKLVTVTPAADRLRTEINLAYLYYSAAELESCLEAMGVVSRTIEILGDEYEKAKGILPSPNAWADYQRTCEALCRSIGVQRIMTLNSLREAATYGRPRPLRALWRAAVARGEAFAKWWTEHFVEPGVRREEHSD